MLNDITLFVCIAAKYENVAALAINQYVDLCENPIKRVFMVCADDVDVSKLTIKIENRYIRDSEAIKILNYSGNEYRCITEDSWMLQQFFKLHCDVLSNTDNCIITDVDALLLKPINYFTGDKINLFYSITTKKHRSVPFKLNYFFNKTADIYNFVTENVLFQRKYLQQARKYLGDFRQYRRAKYGFYDATLEEYLTNAGADWPRNPETTIYKLFYKSSYQNVIFHKLPEWVQKEIIKSGSLYMPYCKIEYGFLFSEYEFYNYFLLLFYPEKVNLIYMPIQRGYIPTENPVFWFNDQTPAGRDDIFYEMYGKLR